MVGYFFFNFHKLLKLPIDKSPLYLKCNFMIPSATCVFESSNLGLLHGKLCLDNKSGTDKMNEMIKGHSLCYWVRPVSIYILFCQVIYHEHNEYFKAQYYQLFIINAHKKSILISWLPNCVVYFNICYFANEYFSFLLPMFSKASSLIRPFLKKQDKRSGVCCCMFAPATKLHN